MVTNGKHTVQLDDKQLIKLLTKRVKALNAENKDLRRKFADLILRNGRS